MLTAADIRFAYNGRPVLAAVGFELQAGRILGVLGVNGAGKSTLLKCLNRILKPQRGTVLLENEDLLQMDRRCIARRAGYIPQKASDTELTVFEAVFVGRKPHIGWTASRADYAIVAGALEQMGLAPLAHRPVSALSGGETQKVTIARALAQSPKILLMDEPTSSLDLKSQLEVLGLIRRIVREKGLAAVVSLHDLNLALRFADYFLFLKDHRVHALVPRGELDAGLIREVYGVEVHIADVAGQAVVVPLTPAEGGA
jgi:iron complex transport system ATP-binding protein